jgi:hypothetical protein
MSYGKNDNNQMNTNLTGMSMGSMPSIIVENLGVTMTNVSEGHPLFESHIQFLPIAV